MMPTDDNNETFALRQKFVDELKRENLVETKRVEAAFREVPRHLFVPGVPLDKVYSDESVITKRQDGVPVSSSSQPAIMAVMLGRVRALP